MKKIKIKLTVIKNICITIKQIENDIKSNLFPN